MADADLQLALRCSDGAAQLALSYFEAGVSMSRKADGSPVTVADLAWLSSQRRLSAASGGRLEAVVPSKRLGRVLATTLGFLSAGPTESTTAGGGLYSNHLLHDTFAAALGYPEMPE